MLSLFFYLYKNYPLAIGTAFVLTLAAIVFAFLNVQVSLVLTAMLMILPAAIFKRKYEKKFGESVMMIFFLCVAVAVVSLFLRSIVCENDFIYNGGWVYSAKVIKINNSSKTKSIDVECLDMFGNQTKENVGKYYGGQVSSYALVAKPCNILNQNIFLKEEISENDYSRFKRGKFVTDGHYNFPESEADSETAQKLIDRFQQCKESFIIDHKIIITIVLVAIFLAHGWFTHKANIYLFSAPIIFMTAVQCYSHCYFYNLELFLPFMAMSCIAMKFDKE
ncbi:MAG: hypothetical protein MJZ46_08455 [Bacteroidales bacterium]|nr:hypothetical protein [Bacteroidales bacterium]